MRKANERAQLERVDLIVDGWYVVTMNPSRATSSTTARWPCATA